MTAIVDTSVLIDHLRGDPRATRLLVELDAAGETLASAVVVRTEILAGMRRGEEARTLALLNALLWQEITVEVADRAGQLAQRYLRSHPGIDTIDYLIAATVELQGGRLLTQNVKHFPMLAGLKPAY